MKLSKYDKNHDGICDASACKNILTITGDREVEKGFIPALSQNLKSIGIDHQGSRAQGRVHADPDDRATNIPFSTRPGWGKDYADALTFFGPLFDGRNIIPQGNTNYSLLGHHARDRQEGRRQGQRRPTSRASTPISTSAACSSAARASTATRRSTRSSRRRSCRGCPTSGPTPRASRAQNVTKFGFDQFGGTIAYAHVAVK